MNNSISIIRVAATLFIVFYHSICYYGIWHFQDDVIFSGIEYWRAVCNIALHIFVFISGYLFAYGILVCHKNYNVTQFIKNKTKRLLIPYLFWGVIAIALFQNCEFHPAVLCGNAQHLWFLLMLFSLFALVVALKDKILKLSALQLWGGVILVQFSYWLTTKFGASYVNYLQWKRVLAYLPSFLAGYAIVRYDIGRFLSRFSLTKLVLFMIAAIVLMICMIIIPNLHLAAFYYYIPTYLYLLFLIEILNRKKPAIGSFVKGLDRCSMGIYIFHHLLIWMLIFYVPGSKLYMIEHPVTSVVLIFISSLLVSWGLTLLIKRNKYLSYIIGG